MLGHDVRVFRLHRPAMVLIAACLLSLLDAAGARAWGNNAQRLVLNKAIDTLPYEIRVFFDNNRADLLRHITDPFDAIAKNPNERHNHYLILEKYGRFPSPAGHVPAVVATSGPSSASVHA